MPASACPGLGVRILGEVKQEYAALLQRADDIFNAGGGEFSPTTTRLTASRPGDAVAHGEKGGLNRL